MVVTAALVMGGVTPVLLAQTAGQDVKSAGTAPKDAAKNITDRIAFWKGVTVTEL